MKVHSESLNNTISKRIITYKNHGGKTSPTNQHMEPFKFQAFSKENLKSLKNFQYKL